MPEVTDVEFSPLYARSGKITCKYGDWEVVLEFRNDHIDFQAENPDGRGRYTSCIGTDEELKEDLKRQFTFLEDWDQI